MISVHVIFTRLHFEYKFNNTEDANIDFENSTFGVTTSWSGRSDGKFGGLG